jgi:hypothetical protein
MRERIDALRETYGSLRVIAEPRLGLNVHVGGKRSLA